MSGLATNEGARRPRTDGGFTLIELIAVIVILGILSIVALPAMNSMDDTRTTMASRQLLRDLTFARQHAVATGTVTWVVFNTGAETWQILEEDTSNPGRANATVMTDPATGQSYTITLGTDAYAGTEVVSAAIDADVEVGFDWLGRPLNAAETALAAQGVVTLNDGHVVNIAAETGYAEYVAP